MDRKLAELIGGQVLTIVNLQDQVARLTRELAEAREALAHVKEAGEAMAASRPEKRPGNGASAEAASS